MTDKKLNVLDRLLCVFKSKKEICPDIISQADGVINQYIYVKNRTIHRKCKKDNDSLVNFIVFGSIIVLCITAFKILF